MLCLELLAQAVVRAGVQDPIKEEARQSNAPRGDDYSGNERTLPPSPADCFARKRSRSESAATEEICDFVSVRRERDHEPKHIGETDHKTASHQPTSHLQPTDDILSESAQ